MRTRRLALKKETLADLTADELAQVAGGNTANTQPVGDCLGITVHIQCDSLLRPCISYTCTLH